MDKSLLRKALADTEDPTPGYLFRDITQMTFVDQITQDKLIAFLLSYLDVKTSVHVLAKCLRIIKHLCEEGHADFQKQMQSKADLLRQFASYRGVNDPKYGDKLNEKVRNCARDAIEASFSHRKASAVQISSGHGSNTVVTEDKKGFTTGMPTTTTGTGNAHMAPMPTSNRWQEEMSKSGAQAGVVSHAGGFVHDVRSGISTGFGLWSENIKSTEQRIAEQAGQTGSFQPVEVPFGGGGTSFGGGGFGGSGAGAASSEWKFTSDTGAAGGGGAAAPARQERVLNRYQSEVEKLCNLKNTPQRVELAQFMQTVIDIHNETSLGYDELAAAMDEKLAQKNSWQHRLHVMTALEHLLRNNPPPQLGAYFVDDPEDIQRNVHVVQTALKEKSQKVLKLLGIAERAAPSLVEPATQSKMATGHGETTWGASVASQQPATSGALGGGGGELDLGGMTVRAGGAGGGRGRGSGVKVADEAPGKLKKRAQMTVAQEDDTSAAATANPWGTAGGGWGAAASNTSGLEAQGSAWSSGGSLAAQPAQSSWGQPTPNGSQAFPQQTAPTQPAPAAPARPAPVALDDLFGPVAGGPAPQQPASTSWAAPPQPMAPAPPPAWGAPAATQPMAPPPPAPAPAWGPSAQPAAPAQPAYGAPAPPPPLSGGASDVEQQRLRIQQQMTALQMQLMQVMASGNPDPSAMQQLLAAQNALLADMARLQQQAAAAPPAATTAPRPEAFASLNDDIKQLARQQ